MKAYQLKITLEYLQPAIWRRITVPADITFKRLHDTIQLAMGWQDSHLYAFDFQDGRRTRITNDMMEYEEYRYNKTKEGKKRLEAMEQSRFMPDMSIEIRKADNTKIDQYLSDSHFFRYTYDFGDDWIHRVELEGIIEDYPFGYPQIAAYEGNCPPEDCGGVPGFEDFIRAWGDESNPEHGEMLEWGESQGYQEYNMESRNESMKLYLKLKIIK